MNKTLSALALTLGAFAFSVSAESNSSTEASSDAVVAPRDAASGLPTGKRQHKPVTMSSPEMDQQKGHNQNSSRTNHVAGAGGGAAQASYAATGMATSGNGDESVASDEAANGVKSPRDAASGQASGKRQHKPVTITKELDKSSPATATMADADGDGADEVSTSPSSMPGGPIKGVSVKSGKGGSGEAGKSADHNSSRSNKSSSITIDEAGTGGGGGQVGERSTPRDAASGQATGKRQHKPMTTNPDLDADNDGISDAEPQGMAINEKGLPGEKKAKAGKTGSAK